MEMGELPHHIEIAQELAVGFELEKSRPICMLVLDVYLINYFNNCIPPPNLPLSAMIIDHLVGANVK